MRRTSKNEPSKNSAPRKQAGTFQIFDLKEVRAEEREAEERAKALEREEAERQAAALKEKMAQMEAATAERQKQLEAAAIERKKRQTIEAAERKRRLAELSAEKQRQEALRQNQKAAIAAGKKVKLATASKSAGERKPIPAEQPKKQLDARSSAVLNRTMDSSKNFSSVHNAARKIAVETSRKKAAPKAELQGMDAFWAEMESARKREAEEAREREIQRARKQELDRARLQETAIAKLQEEENKKRREEEAEKQRELELRRQNEEAAAKWREEEAARVRAEAEKMREIQIQKARDEEAERVKQRELAKIRERQVALVREEEEEKIRRELARFQRVDDQHQQIENMLVQSADEYQEEAAVLHKAEQEELLKQDILKQEARNEGIVTEKDHDTLDDFSFGFPEIPELEEEDVPIDLAPESEEGLIDSSSESSDVSQVIAEDAAAEEIIQEAAEEAPEEENKHVEDDFDEEIIPQNKKTRKTSSRAFVLPSFGQIMDSEKPREARKARIPRQSETGDQAVDASSPGEEIKVQGDQPSQEAIIAETDTSSTESAVKPELNEELEIDTSELPHIEIKPEISIPRKIFNRKKYDAMLGKVVAGSLVVFMVVNAVLPDKSTSEIENRELKQAPKLSVTSITDGSFSKKVEEWQSDQFVGRNVFRNLQTYLSWLGGDREENGVYFGKKGQLLEKLTQPDAELLQGNIDAMNLFAEKNPNTRFIMMLVPDSGTLLADQYPAFAEKYNQSGDMGTVKNLLSERYQWVDALGALASHVDEKIYYKTDHHWTSLGAAYGYQIYCDTLGLQAGSFTVNTISDSFNGVLSSTSGFCLGEKETIDMYVPESNTKVILTYADGRQTATLYDKEKLDTKDQYGVFLGGNDSVIDIKTSTDNDQVLLLFKDSFANSMIPFLVNQYKEIVVVDPRYYYENPQDLIAGFGVTDVCFLYSANTFFDEHNLQGLLNQE